MNRVFKLTAVALISTIALSSASFAFDSSSGSQDDQQACTPDVFRLCSAYIPNADRIVACLKANGPRLSPACHKVMFRKHK